MVCAMESAAGFGVQFFEWLKPSSSSPPSSSSFSSFLSTPSIDRSIIRDGGLDTSLCLPLLGGLEKSPDHGRNFPVKEVLTNITTTDTREEADVELNIGLPTIGGYSSSEETPMDEEAMDEEDEEEDYSEENGKPSRQHDEKCRVEAGDEKVRIEMIEGSDCLRRVGGEEDMIKGIRILCSRGRRFWIPTPAQILIGPVQFICHVCSKTFNRYNNMQVIDLFLSYKYTSFDAPASLTKAYLFFFASSISFCLLKPVLPFVVNCCGCFQVRVLLDFIYLIVQLNRILNLDAWTTENMIARHKPFFLIAIAYGSFQGGGIKTRNELCSINWER
jgi:hypothetical protein